MNRSARVDDSSAGLTYFVADHLNSVTLGVNAAGTVILTREYDPFGKMTAGAAQAGPAYAGQRWDAGIGLYYDRARMYEPELGRFLSDDPAGMRYGINRYVYVRNNPIRLTDPTGEGPSDKLRELFLTLYMIFAGDCRPDNADTMLKAEETIEAIMQSKVKPPTPPPPTGTMFPLIIVSPCILAPQACVCTDKGCEFVGFGTRSS